MTRYVEANIGQDRHASEPQSDKSCDKCIYFDRDLASDEPCGLCYESSDKFNWKEADENPGHREVEPSNYRVCEACPGQG